MIPLGAEDVRVEKTSTVRQMLVTLQRLEIRTSLRTINRVVLKRMQFQLEVLPLLRRLRLWLNLNSSRTLPRTEAIAIVGARCIPDV